MKSWVDDELVTEDKVKNEEKARVCSATATTNGFIANRQLKWCVKVLAVHEETSQQFKKAGREWQEWSEQKGTRAGKKLQLQEVSGNSFFTTPVSQNAPWPHSRGNEMSS